MFDHRLCSLLVVLFIKGLRQTRLDVCAVPTATFVSEVSGLSSVTVKDTAAVSDSGIKQDRAAASGVRRVQNCTAAATSGSLGIFQIIQAGVKIMKCHVGQSRGLYKHKQKPMLSCLVEEYLQVNKPSELLKRTAGFLDNKYN